MLFRGMRRSRQALDDVLCDEILQKGSSGVLALMGDGGYPYALPISYLWMDGKLYFHSAKTGHKIDAILSCAKASFCVVDCDKVMPEKYTTYYRSVIVFGKLRILEDDGEKRAVLTALGQKYNPANTGLQAEINGSLPAVLELTPEHISGKEAIELTRQRQAGN